MKLTTQIGAFIVLIIALGLGILYVNDITIETDVRTRQQTLVPLSYAWDGIGGASGLTLNYPRGWTVQEDLNSVRLLRPETPGDLDSRRNMVLVFEVLEGDASEPLPQALMPSNAEMLDFVTTPAARAVTMDNDRVAFQQIMRLENGDQVGFLRISNAAFISEDVWDDTVQTDLDRITAALDVGDEFTFLPPALTFDVPEGWSLADRTPYAYVMITPPDAAQPQAVAQLWVLPDELALQFSNRLMFIPQGVNPDEAEDMLGLLQAAYGEFEGDEQVTIVAPLQEVTYAGFEGVEVGVSAPNLGELRTVVLNTGDEHDIILSAQVVDPAGYAAYAGDLQTALESIRYTTPEASIYDELRGE